MPSLKTRSSEPSCQRWRERHLFVIVPHMGSVTADALAQSYESEVMVLSKAFTTAILQRNDTGFVTEPHVFSRSADGGSVHSSGDWLAPREGISDIFKDLSHATAEIVSKHGLHNAVRAARAARSLSPLMQENHNDDIFATTKSFLQSAGLQPNLSVHPNQPFRLGLLRNLLQLMQETDIGLIDNGRVRIPHGCVRTNTVLVFGAANRPKHEKTCF